MEEEKSEELDVSYGVENIEESKELVEKPAKTTKKKTRKKARKSKAKSDVTEKVESKPPKKNLIDEINEMKSEGKVDTQEFRTKMGQLETVLGVDSINPFGTNELDIFEDKMKEMNYADLQNLAYKVGINPFRGGSAIKSSLISEFKNYNRNNMRNIMPEASQTIQLDPNNPQHAKTIKILGEI